MSREEKGVIIQNLDLVDIVGFINRKNKKFQASMLQEAETILGKDSSEFVQMRHVVLDGLNEYTRLILKAIFGTSFEGIIDNVPKNSKQL
jgi:hypothetical protein